MHVVGMDNGMSPVSRKQLRPCFNGDRYSYSSSFIAYCQQLALLPPIARLPRKKGLAKIWPGGEKLTVAIRDRGLEHQQLCADGDIGSRLL